MVPLSLLYCTRAIEYIDVSNVLLACLPKRLSAVCPVATTMQQIGTVQHVQCHMGCPMGGMFDNEQLATWTKAVGVAGINGFGWGQLSHIMSWVFQVTKLQPASAFAFMRRSVRCKPHHTTPRHAIPCAFVRAVANGMQLRLLEMHTASSQPDHRQGLSRACGTIIA